MGQVLPGPKQQRFDSRDGNLHEDCNFLVGFSLEIGQDESHFLSGRQGIQRLVDKGLPLPGQDFRSGRVGFSREFAGQGQRLGMFFFFCR